MNPKFDLSSLINLLPTGNNNLNLGSLATITQGMSLSQIMEFMKLLKELNDIKGEVQSIPQDIMHALNQTANVINSQSLNITQLIQQELSAGKRGNFPLNY